MSLSKSLRPSSPAQRDHLIDRLSLRPAAALLAVGFLCYVVMGLLHTGGPANEHEEVFEAYAGSSTWTAVHLGQFASMALIIAGLLVLHAALDLQAGGSAWAARLGAVSAAVTLGLYAVLQAVDGVALKQAVDAWVSAPDGEKVARFASAEAIRWLEWGVRSFQCLMLGLALLLIAGAIVMTARLPRPIGVLMGLSGVTYVVQAWVLGFEGFADANTFAILASYVLIPAWITWLSVIAWRAHPVEAS